MQENIRDTDIHRCLFLFGKDQLDYTKNQSTQSAKGIAPKWVVCSELSKAIFLANCNFSRSFSPGEIRTDPFC